MSDKLHTGGGGDLGIFDHENRLIADLVPAVENYSLMPAREARQNAKELVRRYNLHPALVAALEDSIPTLQMDWMESKQVAHLDGMAEIVAIKKARMEKAQQLLTQARNP